MNDSHLGVPDDLLQQLHDANVRFGDARRHLEDAMEGIEYRHEERVIAAEKKLREVEGEVEVIEKKIAETLKAIRV